MAVAYRAQRCQRLQSTIIKHDWTTLDTDTSINMVINNWLNGAERGRAPLHRSKYTMTTTTKTTRRHPSGRRLTQHENNHTCIRRKSTVDSDWLAKNAAKRRCAVVTDTCSVPQIKTTFFVLCSQMDSRRRRKAFVDGRRACWTRNDGADPALSRSAGGGQRVLRRYKDRPAGCGQRWKKLKGWWACGHTSRHVVPSVTQGYIPSGSTVVSCLWRRRIQTECFQCLHTTNNSLSPANHIRLWLCIYFPITTEASEFRGTVSFTLVAARLDLARVCKLHNFRSVSHCISEMAYNRAIVTMAYCYKIVYSLYNNVVTNAGLPDCSILNT